MAVQVCSRQCPLGLESGSARSSSSPLHSANAKVLEGGVAGPTKLPACRFQQGHKARSQRRYLDGSSCSPPCSLAVTVGVRAPPFPSAWLGPVLPELASACVARCGDGEPAELRDSVGGVCLARSAWPPSSHPNSASPPCVLVPSSSSQSDLFSGLPSGSRHRTGECSARLPWAREAAGDGLGSAGCTMRRKAGGSAPLRLKRLKPLCTPACRHPSHLPELSSLQNLELAP